mmetsp:Transcript_122929/g.244528  ORF Transcript_122929/g.244528 Transcript_122929/m.244528 type:complete len:119 (+) Transcript_122929:66-422(+)
MKLACSIACSCALAQLLAPLAAASSTLLARGRGREDPDRFAREAWLATHLKDVFEINKDGRLAKQSGLNINWNHEETRLRNAKNDCGEGEDSVVAKHQKQMEQAKERGVLKAGRLSAR